MLILALGANGRDLHYTSGHFLVPKKAVPVNTPKRCVSGLVVEWLPATESARVRFPAHAFCKSGATWRLVPNLLMEDARALSSVEERPFRIREVEGSNPSVSI